MTPSKQTQAALDRLVETLDEALRETPCELDRLWLLEKTLHATLAHMDRLTFKMLTEEKRS